MIHLGNTLQKLGPLNAIWSWAFQYSDPSLASSLFGLQFKNPVGLAAGFDKDATVFNFLTYLGFGFVEQGGVTYHPQEGNPKPRVFRLVEDQAIINRMGLNGVGAITFAENLTKVQPSSSLKLVNISKSKIATDSETVDDYLTTFKLVLPHADGFVVNVSCPNQKGVRDLQAKGQLVGILHALQDYKQKSAPENQVKPILVKIAPDLSEVQLDDVIDAVKEVGIQGFIATNTMPDRPSTLQSSNASETGGLSGVPLREKATEVIKFVFNKTKGKYPIIGVGGIFTAEDAYEKIRAGASLVQVYTGMIYEGPMIVKNINKGLVSLLKRDGFRNISEAVGTLAS
jgi:dihydroorotate dehydrogenase